MIKNPVHHYLKVLNSLEAKEIGGYLV